MSFKQRRKIFIYWTRERVDNGLRRYARDFFASREKRLPKSYNAYLESIPQKLRRPNRWLRLYPPPARVLMHYESFAAAWETLGFVLDYRRFEDWTPDEAVRGLKRVYAFAGHCPTDVREYHEIVVSREIIDTKYPPLLTILDLFGSLENAWFNSGFKIESRAELPSPEDDEFVAHLARAEGIELAEIEETSPVAQIIRRVFLRRAFGIIAARAETLKREDELFRAKLAAESPVATKKPEVKPCPARAVKKIHFDKDAAAICRQNEKSNRFNLDLTTDRNAVTCRMCLDILEGKISLCRFRSKEELPEKAYCLQCETEKPIAEIIVVFIRKEGIYRIRPRCKECHNKKERGRRREWKREYLQNWRKNNAEKNESYWKNNLKGREKSRERTTRIWNEKREAVLIQGRMNRHGSRISLKKAEDLLKKFGRCYPMRPGLTEEGLRECEKIRSRFRVRGEKPPKSFDIRLKVYESDGGAYKFVIRPEDQPKPYATASARLKKWHERAATENAGENAARI